MDTGKSNIINMESRIIKGFSVSYQDAPIPITSKYYQTHRSIGASSQVLGRKADSGATSQPGVRH